MGGPSGRLALRRTILDRALALSPGVVPGRPGDQPAWMPAVPPIDLKVGAFSSSPPWIVDPDDMQWRRPAPLLCAAMTAAQVPDLLRRRRLPPGRRVVRVATVLGSALGGWYVLDRRRARREDQPEVSRAGLSRRLRRAFQTLGPTYIKLGQILSSGEGLLPSELVSRTQAPSRQGASRALRDGSPRRRVRTGRAHRGPVLELRSPTPRCRVDRPGPRGHPAHR